MKHLEPPLGINEEAIRGRGSLVELSLVATTLPFGRVTSKRALKSVMHALALS